MDGENLQTTVQVYHQQEREKEALWVQCSHRASEASECLPRSLLVSSGGARMGQLQFTPVCVGWGQTGRFKTMVGSKDNS